MSFFEKFLAGFLGVVSFIKGYTIVLVALVLIEYLTSSKFRKSAKNSK